MDAYGYFCKPENITLPDGTRFDFNRNETESIVRDLTDTARKYINDEYADYLKMFLEGLTEPEEPDDDLPYIEAENEDLRGALNEIESFLQQYESGLESGKCKFSRPQVFGVFKTIHGLINEVI